MRPVNVEEFNHAVQQLRGEFNGGLNRLAGGLRKYSDAQVEKMATRVDELGRVTAAMSATRSGGGGEMAGHIGPQANFPGIKRIEDIPGRRVPFVFAIDISIGPDETNVREGQDIISQEGPFVAVRRMATFQSAFEFRVVDPTTNEEGRFSGRSFGRYRPIHSVCDIMDAQHNGIADATRWWLAAFANPGAVAGTALPGGALGLPSNMSSFRTMEFDARISVINAGSSYPRQNISVPSPFWASECNSPVALGSLDFFERGEVITVRVQPTHVNNPPAGNIDGDCVFPVRTAPAAGTGGWPFLDGQYDAHEGVCTAEPSTLGQAVAPLQPALLATDSAQRVPEGILTVAWEGYRIIQPPGTPA